MRSSYTQHSTFVKCSQYWHNSYVKRYESPDIGASLFFGSAIDASITDLLQGKPEWKQKFFDRWRNAFSNGKSTPVFDNPDVVYAHNDFDADILSPEDMKYLVAWSTELGLDASDPVATYKAIAAAKKNPYKGVNPKELKFFNRASWLSLNKKGEILIDSFYSQFYPKIKRVVAVQQHGSIKDSNTGDSIMGVIDMVLEIEGYSKPIIFDLKTASSPYEDQKLELSEQLTLYAAMKGGEHNTNLVGYVVLCKNINKEVLATCTQCGHKRNGRHATCNNEIGGSRCHGNWLETKIANPQVQVMVTEKNNFQVESLLNDMANSLDSMKKNNVYKNTENCNNWFGGKCPYFNLCHKGDTTGLRHKGE